MEEDDGRLDYLYRQTLNFYRASVLTLAAAENSKAGVKPVRWIQVPALSRSHFPPCFADVQKKLEERNRLGHHARVALTLFLKEIGLPLTEALQFWEH